MACASCGKNKSLKGITDALNPYPFNASDIQVVTNNEVRRFQPSDWVNDKAKLLVIIPKSFTPVCQTELGAINKWYDEFESLNCELIALCTDPAPMMLDWTQEEEVLKDPKYKIFSSYILPTRLGLVENGQAKRASVFITTDGEIVKQEHFNKVGRSFAELHRMWYGFTQDSYCAEGWHDPSDGFLTP